MREKKPEKEFASTSQQFSDNFATTKSETIHLHASDSMAKRAKFSSESARGGGRVSRNPRPMHSHVGKDQANQRTGTLPLTAYPTSLHPCIPWLALTLDLATLPQTRLFYPSFSRLPPRVTPSSILLKDAPLSHNLSTLPKSPTGCSAAIAPFQADPSPEARHICRGSKLIQRGSSYQGAP